MILNAAQSIMQIPVDTYWFMIIITLVIAMGFFLFFVWVFTNAEATFWLIRRHSGKVAVFDFDDSGVMKFKAETPLKQGVMKGENPREYNLQPRNLSGDLNTEINRVTKERMAIFTANISPEIMKNMNFNELLQKTRKDVEKELGGHEDEMKLANKINSFRSFTWGLKIPVFLHYSGKAIDVNPLVAIVASQEDKDQIIYKYGGALGKPLVGLVQNLKNMFSIMITPSQVEYVAHRSELIGARSLGNKMNWTPIIILIGVLGLMLFAVFYILPAVGIKVF